MGKWAWMGVALASYLMLACSGPLDIGSNVVWFADYETGDLSQWTDAGGLTRGEQSGSIVVSSDVAHDGRYALKFTHVGEPGPELYRATDPDRELYYSSWFLIPDAGPQVSEWTIFKFASHDLDDSSILRGGTELQLRSLAGGGYVLNALSHEADQLRAPIPDPPAFVATGTWFHLEVRYRPDPNQQGRFRAWLDNRLVYDLDGRKTRVGDDLLFEVLSLADVDDSFVLYVDSTAISVSRVTPSGVLE